MSAAHERSARDGTYAEVALRCAALRVRASMLSGYEDPSGWLAAQLLDFADLLEVAVREGWLK